MDYHANMQALIVNFQFHYLCLLEYLINLVYFLLSRTQETVNVPEFISQQFFIFYCFTVHFDNIKILFTNKCTFLLNT